MGFSQGFMHMRKGITLFDIDKISGTEIGILCITKMEL